MLLAYANDAHTMCRGSLPSLPRVPHIDRHSAIKRTKALLGPRAQAGVRWGHSRIAGWRRGGRSRAGGGRGRAGGIGRGWRSDPSHGSSVEHAHLNPCDTDSSLCPTGVRGILRLSGLKSCTAHAHKQGSAGATHSLRDGDEADADEREEAAAVPGEGSGQIRVMDPAQSTRARVHTPPSRAST
jgi:hypothetical protein